MTIKTDHLRAVTPCVTGTSSRVMLLFFALPMFWFSVQPSFSQEINRGWSIQSQDSEKNTSNKLTTASDAERSEISEDSDANYSERAVPDSEPERPTEVINVSESIETEFAIADSDYGVDTTSIATTGDNLESNLTDLDSGKSESLTEETLANEETTPKIVTDEIRTTPTLDLDPQLRNSLESIFARLMELQETEDSFSSELGEVYLSYGQALQRAGRLDEAREMYANALHINKINNGVNAVEQRPVLRAMFNLSFAKDDLETAEEQLRRVIWLERQSPDVKDDFSFDMVVRLGNRYIDLYLRRPTNSKTSLALLDKAIRYLKYAVDRYGNRPLEQMLMPYGELALAHYKRSTLQIIEERPTIDSPRSGPIGRLDIERKLLTENRSQNSFERASYYLRRYLLKAQNEGSLRHTVKAYIGLADINLLFNRVNTASNYYELAWQEAQKLPADDPLVLSFDSPTALPNFNYTAERSEIRRSYETVIVPLTFSINEDGQVRKFSEMEEGIADPKLVRSARRVAKRLRFRPIIERGKMIAASEYTHEVGVRKRREPSSRG